MTFSLQALIKQASTELGSEACREGRHQWVSEGSRGCPHGEGYGDESCGQAVYVCTTCGVYDYGERGGPGHTDCIANRWCQHHAALTA